MRQESRTALTATRVRATHVSTAHACRHEFNVSGSFLFCPPGDRQFTSWQVRLRVCLCCESRIVFFFHVLTATSLAWSFLQLLVILLIPCLPSDNPVLLKARIVANRRERAVSSEQIYVVSFCQLFVNNL